jgi:hypothetical protein
MSLNIIVDKHSIWIQLLSDIKELGELWIGSFKVWLCLLMRLWELKMSESFFKQDLRWPEALLAAILLTLAQCGRPSKDLITSSYARQYFL